MAELGARVKVGTAILLSALFTPAGEAAPSDPSEVKLRIRPPSGAVTTLTFGEDDAIVRDAEGTFHCRHVPDAAGTWWYDWSSTGIVDSVAEVAVSVLPLAVPVSAP